MNIEVKNVKTFQGSEGYGFTATLYIDGQKTAVIHDSANGGEFSILQNFKPELFSELEVLAKLQPPEEFHGMEISINWEMLVSPLIDLYQFTKKRRVIIKDVDGEYYSYNIKYSKDRRDQILKKLQAELPGAQLINGSPASRELEAPK